MRTRLGPAWLAFKGRAAPEVWTSLHPALALAKSLGRHDALLPILYGLSTNVGTPQGRVAEALPWAQEMLDIARTTRRYGHIDHRTRTGILLLLARRRVQEVCGARNKVLDLYDDAKPLKQLPR